jgi:ribosomal protein S27E
MAVYADIKEVDRFIANRIAKDRWVIAPSMISSALDWSMPRTIEALSDIYREQVYKLKPSLVVLCDYCSAETLANAQSQAIFDGTEPMVRCSSCGKMFHCTEDNARLSFHVILPDRRGLSGASAGKEAAGAISIDARQ